MPSSKQQGPVARWIHEASGATDTELGQVFRAMVDEEPLSDVELTRLGLRLRGAGKRGARRLFRLLPIVLAVLTGGTGAALAQWARPGIWDVQSWFVAHSAPAPQIAPRQAPKPPPQAPPAVKAPVPADPAPAPLPSAPARSSSSDPGPSTAALESELLQKALEKLRREHDGAGALRLLDDYRTRFPSGLLSLEAAVARVDALLLLGRRAEALQQLSRLPLARVGRRSELQLLRAELYAEQDCRKALGDFDAVLAAAPPAALAERALYGRATCRLRLGDSVGGTADLQSYLSRFPSGRFAPQIRARVTSNGSL